MNLIDTHSHIYLNDFDEDIQQVIDRASDAGVEKIILPNIDASTLELVHQLCTNYPEVCVPLIGLHPTHVKENFRQELETIFKSQNLEKYKGIGEIGIDLYWDKSFFKQQQEALKFQLQVATEHDLPVVIHARDSFREIIDLIKLNNYNDLTGVFHAFTGDIELAKEIIDMGFLLGIGGIVTFKNSNLSEVVKDISLEHIVLETDSPYLTPVPFRGKRNESSYVKYVAEHIAKIKKISLEEVSRQTSLNARNLFKL